MTMTFKTALLTTCAAALLAGCSLAPDYQRPDMPVPQSWPTGPATKASSAQAGAAVWSDVSWKSFFTDSTLQGLIQTALDNNRDLRVAILNIDVARATYRVQESALVPNVSANAGETVARTSKASSSQVPQASNTSRSVSANLGVSSFELDFFGRVRSLNDAALESYLATEEAAASTKISLIAEVSNAYLTLLGDRKLLALTEETLQTRLTSLELVQRSFDSGVSSELDLAQARTAVETARVNRSIYQRQVEQDRNALALLLGQPVDLATLPGELDQVALVADLPVGMPSDVLLRRPDIMQAEHSLKSANANIGAARAAFFPSISLTGAFGLSSLSLDQLFTGAAKAWSFGPSATLPIFDAGKNQANLDSAKASRDIAVASYEKSIQTAFREVADALAAKGTLTEQMQSQQNLVDATQTSYRLSQARYDRGIDSYLTVLDSQRSLYSAQQDLVSVQVSRLSNLVTLYKVLGGGRS